MEQATDQAVSVLNQAQQLADSLIDEAMQSARDLLLTARSQQRDIMEQAKVAANGAVSRATAIAERAGSQDKAAVRAEVMAWGLGDCRHCGRILVRRGDSCPIRAIHASYACKTTTATCGSYAVWQGETPIRSPWAQVDLWH
jgi:vacuolar-type H+-ATPase subunit H